MDTKRDYIKTKIPFFLVKAYDLLKLLGRFFTIRHKVTGKHNFEDPFFIIGSGRSGNTLLRSLLVSSGQVSIPPESYVWPRIFRRYKYLSFLPWDLLCSLVVSEFESYKEFYTWEVNLAKAHQNARKLPKSERTLSNIINCVYKEYNAEKGIQAKRWGDKTPINTVYIDKVLKIFPKGQYIHIVRDPRDVVCSYVKAGLYKTHEEALVFWDMAVKKAIWLKKKLAKDQFYEIRYEDLVSNPEKELIDICAFLKMDYSEEMLLFWKRKNDLGDVKHKQHHKNIGNPISTASIGKWKNTLKDSELDIINNKTKIIRGYYNYI